MLTMLFHETEYFHHEIIERKHVNIGEAPQIEISLGLVKIEVINYWEIKT